MKLYITKYALTAGIIETDSTKLIECTDKNGGEKYYRDFGNTFVADGILRSWQEADRRTFNPEKTLIFEII